MVMFVHTSTRTQQLISLIPARGLQPACMHIRNKYARACTCTAYCMHAYMAGMAMAAPLWQRALDIATTPTGVYTRHGHGDTEIRNEGKSTVSPARAAALALVGRSVTSAKLVKTSAGEWRLKTSQQVMDHLMVLILSPFIQRRG